MSAGRLSHRWLHVKKIVETHGLIMTCFRLISSISFSSATLNTLFWLILNLTGRILGRFGVRPANVGPGRGLGFQPGRAAFRLGRVLARPAKIPLADFSVYYKWRYDKMTAAATWSWCFIAVLIRGHLYRNQTLIGRRKTLSECPRNLAISFLFWKKIYFRFQRKVPQILKIRK